MALYITAHASVDEVVAYNQHSGLIMGNVIKCKYDQACVKLTTLPEDNETFSCTRLLIVARATAPLI